MNHIYRSIWNAATGTCVAASEHVSCSGKRTSTRSGPHSLGQVTRLRCNTFAVAVMLACGGLAQAEPTGGVVTAGSATVAASPGRMTITQATPGVVINWQSFGISAGESVHFVQPGSSSVALNRVVGSDPSQLLGGLSANGQVFLVNPSGILFGPGASMNVGGLVASTLNIRDADFMAGRYHFAGAGTGTVVNQGEIRATDGGYVALLGHNVNNHGVVAAQLGTVALAAGHAMTLDVLGDRLLHVAIDQGVAQALVNNGGLLQADGGKVLMTTQAAGNLLANAVNNTGVVLAQTLENHNGTIVLQGSVDAGTVGVGGTLNVDGRGAGQTGGQVTVTGHHVGLFDARIQASGDAGGGVVLVGGDYQGRNASVPNATATYMSAGSVVQADAVTHGNGGKVVLWSDGSTRTQGQIAARGGSDSGDGGLVETSGHWLNVHGLRVDTRAAHGRFGNWLLDPADVTISSSATTGATATGGVFAPDAGVGTANINVADLVTALGGTNVTVTTENNGVSGAGLGDINVDAAITWTDPTTLTLVATRDVNINQAVTGTDGSLAANAGRDVNVDAAVSTTTGNLAYTAVNDVNLAADHTITTGNLTAVAGRNVNVTAPATVTTGNMAFRADNDGTGPGIPAGTVTITCGSNCLTVGIGGVLSIRFNPASYASTGGEVLAYDDPLTGGGTLDAKAWVFGAADDRMYDGTTTATVSGLLPDVTAVPPPVALGAVVNANFDTKHVGTDKPVTFETTFADATYDLFAPLGTTPGTYQARADILVRPLTVSAVTDTRPYNGTTSSDGVPTAEGLQPGDTLDGPFTQLFADKDVLGTNASTLVADGSYTVSDGNGGSNYAVSVVTAPGTITPLPLTVTSSDVTKVYGEVSALTGFSTTALVSGETVGSVTATSPGQPATASAAGSPYAITPSDATGGTFTPSNYTISYISGVLRVLPAVPEPPDVDPPVFEPPVVVPPVIRPPVVVPPVVAPPVVVPPVIEPPVVVPPVVISPVTPPMVPPGDTDRGEAVASAVGGLQSLPPVSRADARSLLFRVAPHGPIAQGPLTFAAADTPQAVPPAPAVAPAPASPSAMAAPPVAPSVVREADPPPPRTRVIPVFPPKQDRN